LLKEIIKYKKNNKNSIKNKANKNDKLLYASNEVIKNNKKIIKCLLKSFSFFI
jgi:hypothetical protein